MFWNRAERFGLIACMNGAFACACACACAFRGEAGRVRRDTGWTLRRGEGMCAMGSVRSVLEE